jgi:nickel-dependent lactate racemase
LTRIELRYGSGRIALAVPDENFVRLVTLEDRGGGDSEALSRAVSSLGSDPEFTEAVRGRTVALLLNDATRSEPREEILPAAARLLAPAARVLAFLATGTHDPRSADNRALAERVASLLGAGPLRGRFEVVLHDAHAGDLLRAGTTRRDVPVLVNPRSREADAFLAVSDVKHHYFAGYSNPVKSLVPGIAGLETVRANHAMALDPRSTFGVHPLHPDPARRTSPLADDQWEAVQLVLGGRPFFSLWIFTHGREIRFAGAGPVERACAEAIAVADREASVTVEPADLLLVTPGGYPHDESLYTAQRALELTKRAVRDGGAILFLAECRNGIGPPGSVENFYEPLTRPLSEVIPSLAGGYRMYAHKPAKFAELLQRVEAIHAKSALADDVLRRIHLEPAPSPQEVVDAFLARRPRARVLAFEDASKFAVHAAPPP